VVRVAVTIGIQRRKLLESTLRGVETMDLRYIGGREATRRENVLEPGGYAVDKLASSIGSILKRFKNRVGQQAQE